MLSHCACDCPAQFEFAAAAVRERSALQPEPGGGFRTTGTGVSDSRSLPSRGAGTAFCGGRGSGFAEAVLHEPGLLAFDGAAQWVAFLDWVGLLPERRIPTLRSKIDRHAILTQAVNNNAAVPKSNRIWMTAK